MDLVEILSFLFQLSFSTLGRVSLKPPPHVKEGRCWGRARPSCVPLLGPCSSVSLLNLLISPTTHVWWLLFKRAILLSFNPGDNTISPTGGDLYVCHYLFTMIPMTLKHPLFPQDYSVEGMSESLLTFLQHLREFGLVFQRKVKCSYYQHPFTHTVYARFILGFVLS